MNTEIFIEGQQLDITNEINALFTYAVDDVADFAARNTNYSKTIKLPGTANNNKLFGSAFEFVAYNPYDSNAPNVGVNFNAAKAARGLVLVNGIQVFKGILRLLKITITDGFIEYECAVFGELGGLAGAIGNRQLTGNASARDDLDFSAYNQLWNVTNIVASWSAHLSGGGGTGVYFPLIDYGQVSADKVSYKFTAMRPALYVRQYLAKIFEKAGYTYDAAFFETAFFKRLIIPHNEDQLYVLVYQLFGGFANRVLHFLRKNIFSTTGLTDLLTADIPFPNNTPRNITVGGGDTTLTYAGATTGFFYFTYGVRLLNAGNVGTLTMSVRKNGAAITGYGGAVNLAVTPNTAEWNFNGTGPQAAIAPGDVITVNITLSGVGSVPPTTPIDIKLDVANFFIKTLTGQAAPVLYNNDKIDMAYAIPKQVSQKDLLLSIVKMFGLRIIEDPLRDKHVKILTFAEFFSNTSPADWSQKVDRSKAIELTPMSELNARYFNFLYDSDNDHYNETYKKRQGVNYGDRTFDAGLDFVKDKQDLKVIFAPSPLIGYAGKDKKVTTILKYESGIEAPTESKIRILQAKVLGASVWAIIDASGKSVLLSNYVYGYAGHVDDPNTPQGADLNFGALKEIYWAPTAPYTAPNLFNAFYSSYMAEITDKDSKLLTCYVRLSPLDIYNLDFSKAILIDGQLWRLNKIIDYDPVEEGVTKCELLKVINIAY